MAKTQYTSQGIPGQVRVFIAKTAAAITHTGLFTTYSVQGIPSQRYSFIAKTPVTVTPSNLWYKLRQRKRKGG